MSLFMLIVELNNEALQFMTLSITASEEISKMIRSKSDLLKLSQRLNFGASDIIQAMCTIQSFPPHLIRACVLQMLEEWVHGGEAREAAW